MDMRYARSDILTVRYATLEDSNGVHLTLAVGKYPKSSSAGRAKFMSNIITFDSGFARPDDMSLEKGPTQDEEWSKIDVDGN